MGLAYTPDGQVMTYERYVNTHPHWQAVRKQRFEFDEGRCVVCHKDLHGEIFHTHHLQYQRVGDERLRDVVTMCEGCHKIFHQNWERSQFWVGKEEGHWEVYDLQHTAKICSLNWRHDRLISRDPNDLNMCSRDVCRQLLDEYIRDAHLTKPPRIDPNDISLFIRNKRYELFFEAEERGLTVEQFLDEYYGPKVRGKNPLRQEAGRKKGPFDHKPASFHRHYLENKNINVLMEEVEKMDTFTQGGFN